MWTYRHVHLESFGYVLPETVVSSSALERDLADVYARFGLHEGRLELMTGIRERRFWEEGVLPSDPAARAGRRALEAAGLEPADMECLLYGAVSRDCLEPATASIVHHHLGLPPRSILYDISNACLGFLNGMICLANMIELGQVRRGLVVSAESSRSLVRTTIDQLRAAPNPTRRALKGAFASLTIGSGAVALVMVHESAAASSHRLIGGTARSATEHNHLCRGSADTGFGRDAAMSMNTDSEMLLLEGCELAATTWRAFLQELGWSLESVDRVFTHQVGAAHRERMFEAIGLDKSRDFSTFEHLGNVGSASLPLTMALGVEQRPPRRGERLALLGIGSGLSCVMLGVEW